MLLAPLTKPIGLLAIPYFFIFRMASIGDANGKDPLSGNNNGWRPGSPLAKLPALRLAP